MAGILRSTMGRKPIVGEELQVSLSGVPLAAATLDGAYLWTNQSDRRYAIVKGVARYSTAGSTGALATVERVATAVAAGSGADIHTTGGEWNIESGGANTNLYLGIDDTQGASGKNIVEPGESLYIETAGTLTNLVGFVCTLTLRQVFPLVGA